MTESMLQRKALGVMSAMLDVAAGIAANIGAPDETRLAAADLAYRVADGLYSVAKEGLPTGLFPTTCAPRSREEALSLHIQQAGFSIRTSNCLQNLGCTTIGDVCARKESEIAGHRHFGRKSMVELKAFLAEWGLELSPEETPRGPDERS